MVIEESYTYESKALERKSNQIHTRNSLSRKIQGLRRKVINFTRPKIFRSQSVKKVEKKDKCMVDTVTFFVEIDNENFQTSLLRTGPFSAQGGLHSDEPIKPDTKIVKGKKEEEDDIISSSNTTEENLTDESSTEGDGSAPISLVQENNLHKQDIPAVDNPNQEKGASAISDGNFGCITMQTPLWSQCMCGSIVLTSVAFEGPTKVVGFGEGEECQVDPWASPVVRLQGRQHSEPLAWLGSPMDGKEDGDDDSIVQKEDTQPSETAANSGTLEWLGQIVHRGSDGSLHLSQSPMLSFSFGKTTGSISPPGSRPAQDLSEQAKPEASKSNDSKQAELAKRLLFKEYLRLSAEKLMKEQERTENLVVEEEAVGQTPLLNHISWAKERNVLRKENNVDRKWTKDLPAKTLEFSEKQENALPKQDEPSPVTVSNGTPKEQQNLVWRDDSFQQDIDNFRFEANFPEMDSFGAPETADKKTIGDLQISTTDGELGGPDSVDTSRDESNDEHESYIMGRTSVLISEKIMENENGDFVSKSLEDDSVSLESIVQELQDLERSWENREDTLQPIPPPPKPQQTPASILLLYQPLPPPPPPPPRQAIQARPRRHGHLEEPPEQLAGMQDRYSVEQETNLQVETLSRSMMDEFAIQTGRHTAEASVTEQSQALSETPGRSRGWMCERKRDPPAMTPYGNAGNVVQNLFIRPADTSLSGFDAGVIESEESEEYKDGNREFAKVECAPLAEEERNSGTDDLELLSRTRSTISHQALIVCKTKQDPPCEEILVRNSFVRTKGDPLNNSKKRVSFDLHRDSDMYSLESHSTQGLSVSSFRQDAFYGCVSEDVTRAIVEGMSTILDDYSNESIDCSSDSMKSLSYDDYFVL